MKYFLLTIASFFIVFSVAVNAEENGYAPTGGTSKVIELVVKAVKGNNQVLISKYVEYGGNVNVQDGKGYTPLIYAAYYGHDELVDFLLKNGANACMKDKRGNTALMGAIFKGNVKAAIRLMKAECDVDQNNNANQTALMYATLFGREKIATELISRGASIEVQDTNGKSAMSIAKDQFNQKMITLLEKYK